MMMLKVTIGFILLLDLKCLFYSMENYLCLLLFSWVTAAQTMASGHAACPLLVRVVIFLSQIFIEKRVSRKHPRRSVRLRFRNVCTDRNGQARSFCGPALEFALKPRYNLREIKFTRRKYNWYNASSFMVIPSNK
jgi:hypothetical protein